MKALFVSLLCVVFLHAFARAEDTAGQVLLQPEQSDFAADTTFTLSFPDAMVSPDRINAGDVEWPVTVTPKADARFFWTSTTEGTLEIRGQVAPGTHYRIATTPKLHDARGHAVSPKTWEFDSPAFDLKTSGDDDGDKRVNLSTQPRFSLEANYPIAMLDAAEHLFFQDRDSHERFAVDVLLDEGQAAERETSLTVQPRQPLPMGHAYDLVAEGLCDAFARKPLPFLKVFAAGVTKPLELQWIGAFNQPQEKPLLRVKFSEAIDPESVTPAALRITPEVADLRLHAEQDEIIAEGTFDLKTHYRVEVGTAARGIRGFPLAKAERWGATFHPKEPTLVFPDDQVFQRSARGLKFSFLQVNTGPVKWRLLSVPIESIPEVADRVTGYEKGEPPFDFPAAGEGSFEANDGPEEVLRQIDWRPAKPLSGPYLLEVSSTGEKGVVIGNRALVCFSEYVLTTKRTESEVIVRVAAMADGRAASGVKVSALTAENATLGEAVTDTAGLAHFSAAALYPKKEDEVKIFLARTSDGPALQYADAPTLGTRDFQESRGKSPLRGLLVTDRNLYRPGQTVKMHGLFRLSEKGELSLPPAGQAGWQVKPVDNREPVAHGEAPLTAHGSWDSEWVIPATLPTGDYEIYGGLGADSVFLGAIHVEEYRAPLFSVELTPLDEPGVVAQMKVSSTYFHGAPNAGAQVHWSAVWSQAVSPDEDEFVRSDQYSEHHPDEDEVEAQGDASLDVHGQVLLRSEAPFRDHRLRGRAFVSWRVDVTSAEAQTFTGGAESKVQPQPGWAGLRVSAEGGANPKIVVEANALDLEDEPLAGTKARLELYHVLARTVKERIAPHILRYRNTQEFIPAGTREITLPAKVELPVKETGDYVAVLVSPGDILASARATLSGEETAELPVENETAIGVSLPEPKRVWKPGETVPITVRAPFAGTAWVAVETSELLETMLVPLAGNVGRIDLPVKKEYAPNVTVSVYLVQPGGAQGLPRERLGQVNLEVERPDRALEVQTKLAETGVRPGAPVRGELLASSDGAPVAGAEFVVFAVDEAVLRLGDWKLPEPLQAFYPPRSHTVETHAALTRFVEQIDPKSLHQKGYVVGGGGEGLGNVALRKEFKTLAFWQAGLQTDAQGKIHFEFPAPDNLTEYRLVAIGQTDRHQFGGGSVTFKVSKPLLAEPALPRFVRIGDELTLRAVVRQSKVAKGRVTVRCVTEGLELQDQQPASQETAQDIPAAFGFKARVGDVSSTAKVRFEVSSDFGEQDAVEVSLPVLPPAVLRHETVAANFTAPVFRPANVAPGSWAKGVGTFSVTLSTSPWLPKLNGLPAILTYPHGCFEQISTRVLAYTQMNDLLSTLPDAAAREARYQSMLKISFQRYEEAPMTNGLLPYWPGYSGTTRNPFATTLAAWAVSSAPQLASAGLRERFATALEQIANGQVRNGSMAVNIGSSIRCLALMVVARPEVAEKYGAAAQDLYLRRDHLSDEACGLLALAMHAMKILPREQAQLLKEIVKPTKDRAFDPETFSSTQRAEAISTLALARLAPEHPELKVRRERLLKAMEESGGFSTQENFWTLLAFRAVVESHPAPPLEVPGAKLTSRDHTGAAWPANDLARLAAFTVEGLPPQTPLTALVSAEYRSTEPETDRTDRGLRVERVVRDLTHPERFGTAEAPFRLGDQLLVTYRVVSRNRHFYLALEDLLPAGLETVNPNLPLVAKTFHLPPDQDGRLLELSHSELRDQSTCLYFDELEPGVGKYSVLARATSAGTFRWPAAQIYPMYDSRFTGLSTAELCVVQE